MCKSYLPIYGNKYWRGKTPNIDELAEKGTVFNHFIAAAPSTVMSFRAMMTGKFAHEQPYDRYVPLERTEDKTDFFCEASRLGYKCHIIWDENWEKVVLRYGNCYGKETIIHNLPGLKQGVGCYYNRKEPVMRDERKSEKAINTLMDRVNAICNNDENILLWIHLPHVINGRNGYGTDIDLLDLVIGRLREYFEDDCIFISADHGNMNGFHGKVGYGFDVDLPAIEIPLITPRIESCDKECDLFLSNVDVKDLILYRKITKRDFIFSDCAYYAQPHRKIAIIHNGMLYQYSKATQKEFLYDIMIDPNEKMNLINDIVYDGDRKLHVSIKEVYFYPSWEKIARERVVLRNKKDEVWKNAPLLVELREKFIRKAKNIYIVFKYRFFK
ncbi:MAG: sulfatase-like hydrolase/transferase [Thermoguttaceae bacterium]|nr:sulfatase-like hydrolase/transferase [Thermoguttaceae bacterium]